MNTIMQPGEVEPPKGRIPFLFLPRGDVLFARRARRFAALAKNHALGDFLRLMGRLSQAQQTAMDNLPPLSLLSEPYLEECRQQRLPPLGVLGWQRDPDWHEALRQILADLATTDPPPAVQEAMEQLGRTDPNDLERLAAGLLNQDLESVPAGLAPFLAAALQVYWTAMAAALPRPDLPRLDQTNLCPVCGSPPVAGIVRSGGNENGLRYLCCSLCASQWHKVRGICSNCDNGKGITYYGIEGQPGPVTAESCGECRSYLKIIKLEKDTEADPLTDDLAMLALDLLMEQSGNGRIGNNLLFHPGKN